MGMSSDTKVYLGVFSLPDFLNSAACACGRDRNVYNRTRVCTKPVPHHSGRSRRARIPMWGSTLEPEFCNVFLLPSFKPSPPTTPFVFRFSPASRKLHQRDGTDEEALVQRRGRFLNVQLSLVYF